MKIMSTTIKGKVFVLDDNIDTDQIIPAEYLTLVPSKPDEYEKLGSYAMIGLPDRYARFIPEGESKTIYSIIIAGENFGCGSRNCTATGELYPWESVDCLVESFKTGEEATIDFDNNLIINETTGETFALKSLGDVRPVIDAGGLFDYARLTGMIPTRV